MTFGLSIITVVVWNLIWEQNHSKVKYRIKHFCSTKVDSKVPHKGQVKFWFFLSIFLNFGCSILHLHILHIYKIKTREVKTLTISGGLKFALRCFYASSNFYANGCNLVNFVFHLHTFKPKVQPLEVNYKRDVIGILFVWVMTESCCTFAIQKPYCKTGNVWFI